jgi:hypothetical protein
MTGPGGLRTCICSRYKATKILTAGVLDLHLHLFPTTDSSRRREYKSESPSAIFGHVSERRDPRTMSKKPAIVISPGGGHEPGAYKRFVDYLVSQDYDVTAVSLASSAIASSPSAFSPSDVFAADVAVVAEAITKYAEAGRDVVVLCHSFGGLPGSTACKDLLKTARNSQGKPGGVVHVIYLAAMGLPRGASLFSLIGGEMPPWADVSEDGKTLIPKDIRALFREERMTEDDLEELVSNIKPLVIQTWEGQVGFEPWREVDATYIHTLADTPMPIDMQRMMVANVEKAMEEDGKGKKLNTLEIEGGHEPFTTMPEKLGEVFRSILGEVVN